jgi:hypothetical protein
MGIADPQKEMTKRAMEEMSATMWRIKMSEMEALSQMQIQQMQMQMQMQMQQAAQQPPPQPEPPMGGDASYFSETPLAPPTPPIGPQISGQGYNSAAGGIPPSLVNPDATRETQTGFDGRGVPLQ